MQQVRFDSRIGAHRQCEITLWPGQAAGTLDQLASHGAELFKTPQRCALFGGIALFRITEHLHFPVEIVRQYGRKAWLPAFVRVGT